MEKNLLIEIDRQKQLMNVIFESWVTMFEDILKSVLTNRADIDLLKDISLNGLKDIKTEQSFIDLLKRNPNVINDLKTRANTLRSSKTLTPSELAELLKLDKPGGTLEQLEAHEKSIASKMSGSGSGTPPLKFDVDKEISDLFKTGGRQFTQNEIDLLSKAHEAIKNGYSKLNASEYLRFDTELANLSINFKNTIDRWESIASKLSGAKKQNYLNQIREAKKILQTINELLPKNKLAAAWHLLRAYVLFRLYEKLSGTKLGQWVNLPRTGWFDDEKSSDETKKVSNDDDEDDQL